MCEEASKSMEGIKAQAFESSSTGADPADDNNNVTGLSINLRKIEHHIPDVEQKHTEQAVVPQVLWPNIDSCTESGAQVVDNEVTIILDMADSDTELPDNRHLLRKKRKHKLVARKVKKLKNDISHDRLFFRPNEQRVEEKCIPSMPSSDTVLLPKQNLDEVSCIKAESPGPILNAKVSSKNTMPKLIAPSGLPSVSNFIIQQSPCLPLSSGAMYGTPGVSFCVPQDKRVMCNYPNQFGMYPQQSNIFIAQNQPMKSQPNTYPGTFIIPGVGTMSVPVKHKLTNQQTLPYCVMGTPPTYRNHIPPGGTSRPIWPYPQCNYNPCFPTGLSQGFYDQGVPAPQFGYTGMASHSTFPGMQMYPNVSASSSHVGQAYSPWMTSSSHSYGPPAPPMLGMGTHRPYKKASHTAPNPAYSDVMFGQIEAEEVYGNVGSKLHMTPDNSPLLNRDDTLIDNMEDEEVANTILALSQSLCGVNIEGNTDDSPLATSTPVKKKPPPVDTAEHESDHHFLPIDSGIESTLNWAPSPAEPSGSHGIATVTVPTTLATSTPAIDSVTTSSSSLSKFNNLKYLLLNAPLMSPEDSKADADHSTCSALTSLSSVDNSTPSTLTSISSVASSGSTDSTKKEQKQSSSILQSLLPEKGSGEFVGEVDKNVGYLSMPFDQAFTIPGQGPSQRFYPTSMPGQSLLGQRSMFKSYAAPPGGSTMPMGTCLPPFRWSWETQSMNCLPLPSMNSFMKGLNCRGTGKVDAKRFKPRHFDILKLKVGYYDFATTGTSWDRIGRIKLIFSRRTLVYEFQLNTYGEAILGKQRQMTSIDVAFKSIIGINCNNNEIKIEVDCPPLMYMGIQNLESHGPLSAAHYDRKNATANLHIAATPYHIINLKQRKGMAFAEYLTEFDESFNILLSQPFVEDPFKRSVPDIVYGPQVVVENVKSQELVKSQEPAKIVEAPIVVHNVQKSYKPSCQCQDAHACLDRSQCSCAGSGTNCDPALCMCHVCCNPMNVLKDYDFDLLGVKIDTCMFSAVYKIEDLLEYLYTEVTFPCCKMEAGLISCVPGLVACPNYETCQRTFKYSWCTGTLCDEIDRPRNHCKFCRICRETGYEHCQKCDKCYFAGYTGLKCPVCKYEEIQRQM